MRRMQVRRVHDGIEFSYPDEAVHAIFVRQDLIPRLVEILQEALQLAAQDKMKALVGQIASLLSGSIAAWDVEGDTYSSTANFIETLGFELVRDAAERAIAKGLDEEEARFRYFCGICWRRIRARLDRPAGIPAGDDLPW